MRLIIGCAFCIVLGGYVGSITTDKEIDAAYERGRLNAYNEAMKLGFGHWDLDEDVNTPNEFIWRGDMGRQPQTEEEMRGQPRQSPAGVLPH